MNSRLEMKKFGEIEGVLRKGDPGGPLVVMIHGYGADCHDLISLSEGLSKNRELSWFFPNGVFEVPIGPHMMGRAWFAISAAEIEAASQYSSGMRTMANGRPKGFDKGVKTLSDSVQMISEELKITAADIIFGGFSQGAMMAMELAASALVKPLGLALLSGTLVDKGGLKKKLPKLKGLSFLQSHGKQDTVLGHAMAFELYQFLEEEGLHGEWIEFNGGHGIPVVVLQRFHAYVKECLFRRSALSK